MATAKMKKSRRRVKDPSGVSGSTFDRLFSNCNIQFGNGNVMKVTEVQKCLQDSSELKDFGVTKNEFGIYLVRTILSSSPRYLMSFEDLNTEIKKAVSEVKMGKTSSFKDVCDIPLSRFLEKNNDFFDKFKRKGTDMVKLRHQKPKEPVKEYADSDNFYTGEESFSDTSDSLSTAHSLQRETSIEDDTPVKGKENRSKASKSVGEETWSVVGKRKQKKKKKGEGGIAFESVKKPSYYALMQQSLDVEDTHCLNEFSLDEFQSLLKKKASSDLTFYESDDVYRSCPCKFMQDLVSMWNSPQRQRSHIVLGVRSSPILPHTLVGLKSKKDDSFYQNIVKENLFTMKPMFIYYQVVFESKIFDIIQIQSSFGHGIPSICKESVEDNGVVLTEGQLWYHPGTENVVCKPTDMTTASIYQWFAGGIVAPNEDKSTKPAVKRTKATKNAGTSTATGERDDCDADDENYRATPGRTFSHFWKCVKSFNKGHFVLLTGDISNRVKHLEAFSRVPWIAVYDFDRESGSKGLLNATQDFIERRRCLRICTWNDDAKPVSESGTTWCFMRGRQGVADSRTSDTEGMIEDANSWYKTVKRGMQMYIEHLVKFEEDYTVITLVLLWPNNELLVPIMQKFISSLADQLEVSPSVVLWMPQQPRTEQGQARFSTLCSDFNKTLNVCIMDLESLCHGIIDHLKNENVEKISLSLPTADGSENPDITEQEATWLREDMEVLYLSNPYLHSGQLDIEAEINNFFRGGTLPWSAWYEIGPEGVGIERDVMAQIDDEIKAHTQDTVKSGVITVLHAPGSGGSTLAQRLLMRYHDRYPSVQVKKNTSGMDDFVGRVSFLHDRTHLPILILLDGSEETFVRQLSKCLKYVTYIIINVKRYPYVLTKKERDKGKIFLSGNVSKQEARKLSQKFAERCDCDSNKGTLQRLSQDVQDGTNHYLYEFGMTAYLHDFKGVMAYVRGYLRLQENPSKALQPWQVILGYLALVYYYGHTSVPCQFFTTLLNKPPNFVVSIEDFKHPISEFIVSDLNEGRKNHIRICHYVVAQEILEQILTRHKPSPSNQRSDRLSLDARKNLKKLCLDFIEYCKKKKTKSITSGTPVSYILTKTFIFRDDRDMGDEKQSRKKPLLSRVMIDIPSDTPLFTERLQVLEKLVHSFPDDPNFRAHLGRFFAYCRPDEDDKAEVCFQKAIQLCEKQTKGKAEDDIDERMKLTLMHIYHMYGIIKHRQVTRFTGRSQRESPERRTTPDQFSDRLSVLAELAESACKFFEKSRDVTPPTHDVFLYAYTKEIEVRLQICEFVNRHYRLEGKNIVDFLTSETDHSAKQFILLNIPTVENLIMECYSDFGLVEDQEVLHSVIRWYNSLFMQQALRFDDIVGEDEIGNRRLQIAAKKLQFGNKNSFTVLESIHDGREIAEIIDLYEKNFQDIENFGLAGKSSKRVLDLEYREWMFAIRHDRFERVYEVENVLLFVQQWYDQLRSPLSLFYLFVMKSLLGFGTETSQGKTPCLQDAKALQEDLSKASRIVVRSNYPREWLGRNENGIKRLLPGNRFNVRVVEDNRLLRHQSMVCRGTIKHPNNKNLSGAIDYDLGIESVRVFFIPKIAELNGTRFAGRRVEFNLAFSFEHGYEAYNVKLLKLYGCSQCSIRLEITSDRESVPCKCGTTVYRDDLSEVEVL